MSRVLCGKGVYTLNEGRYTMSFAGCPDDVFRSIDQVGNLGIRETHFLRAAHKFSLNVLDRPSFLKLAMSVDNIFYLVKIPLRERVGVVVDWLNQNRTLSILVKS